MPFSWGKKLKNRSIHNSQHGSGVVLNPEKLVLTSHPTKDKEYATLSEVLSHLYTEKKQSLIVEGGNKTLESFLKAGLWDEIRVETAPFTIEDGVRAPQLPHDIHIVSAEEYGNKIITYERN